MTKALMYGDWLFVLDIYTDHIDGAMILVRDGVLTRDELEEACDNGEFVFGYYTWPEEAAYTNNLYGKNMVSSGFEPANRDYFQSEEV